MASLPNTSSLADVTIAIKYALSDIIKYLGKCNRLQPISTEPIILRPFLRTNNIVISSMKHVNRFIKSELGYALYKWKI